MTRKAFHASSDAMGQGEALACSGVEALTLAAAEPGRSYHITSLGETRLARLELLSAGLAPEAVVNLVRGTGGRPRIVACDGIRAAIGAELASGVRLSPCGPGCGCAQEVRCACPEKTNPAETL